VLPKSSVQPSSYKRDSYNGYGNGLARAFELTATPALFGFIGRLIDRKAGTSPFVMISLILFAIVGMFIKLWYGYDNEMKHHEHSLVASQGHADPAAVRARSAVDAFGARATLATGVTLDTDTLADVAQPSNGVRL
jgi:F0F1-type ATP synthase assembly protein I